MTERSDVAVIGGGILGLSTAYSLLERGVAVTVYEQGMPGNGQSGGESRIFRHAHADPRLVALACRSRAIWREWEQALDVELVSGDGVVALGPSVEASLGVLRQVGSVAARPIDSVELSERLPLLAGYSGPAMLDESGGSIRAVTAIRELARRLGGSLVADEVISVRSTRPGTVEVRTGGGCSAYTRAVVCAGRRTSQLARGVGLVLPVRQAAHVRLTFALETIPLRGWRACRTGAGNSARPGSTPPRRPATATTRWGSAKRSTYRTTAASSILPVWLS